MHIAHYNGLDLPGNEAAKRKHDRLTAAGGFPGSPAHAEKLAFEHHWQTDPKGALAQAQAEEDQAKAATEAEEESAAEVKKAPPSSRRFLADPEQDE